MCCIAIGLSFKYATIYQLCCFFFVHNNYLWTHWISLIILFTTRYFVKRKVFSLLYIICQQIKTRSLFTYEFLRCEFPRGNLDPPPLPRSAHRTYQSFYRILNRNKKNNCSYMYQIRFFNSTPNITKIHMYTNFKNNHWRTIYSLFFLNVQCRKQQLKYSRCSTVCLLNIYSIIPIMSPEL